MRPERGVERRDGDGCQRDLCGGWVGDGLNYLFFGD